MKLIKQYTGHLTPAQAAQGINSADKNARDLLFDAKLLYDHSRWARSCALAILSIEESAKIILIRYMLLARDDKELNADWKAYRSHSFKSLIQYLPTHYRVWKEAISQNKKVFREGNLTFRFDEIENNSPVYDLSYLIPDIKELAFYSDALLYSNDLFNIPNNSFDSNNADHHIKSATRAILDQPQEMRSEEELKLWVKHLKPVWGQKSREEIKSGLFECYNEAKDRGIMSYDIDPEVMATYMYLW